MEAGMAESGCPRGDLELYRNSGGYINHAPSDRVTVEFSDSLIASLPRHNFALI